MIHADLALARRIERAEAENARGCTAAHPQAAAMAAAGGIAVFAGADSPLSRAVGMGLSGPVPEEELRSVEEFFRARSARPVIDLCPLVDPSLTELLLVRGYGVTEFDNVMVRRLAGIEMALTPRVRRGLADEVDLWSHTVGAGFFEHSELTTGEMDVGRAICAMPGAMWYLASLESGELAGGAAVAIHAGLATLFADSTIPAYRRRGIHRELISARLNEALAQGCDLATASAMPGSASQRNYERLGFEVAYTRLTMGL
jgi:GNAT superfamily N-acetyltransferase